MTIHMMYQSSWFQSLSLKTTAGRKLLDHWEVEGQGADHLNQHQGGGEGRTMTGSLKTPCASI